MATQNITGNVADVVGTSQAGAVIEITAVLGAWNNGAKLILGDTFTVTADASGDVDFDVESGDYRCVVQLSRGTVTFGISVGTSGPYGLQHVVAQSNSQSLSALAAEAAASASAAQAYASMPYEDRATAVAALGSVGAAVNRVPWIGVDGAKSLEVARQTGATEIPDMLGWVPAAKRASLEVWGITGTGLVDEKTKLDAAIASGRPLTGKGLVVGVSGRVDLIAASDIHDLHLKQLSPGASASVITLLADGVDNLDLRRIKVNRNGDGTNGGYATGANGCLSTARGIYINGGTGHRLEDLEVTGDDTGTGILFNGLDSSSIIIRPYAHDMTAVNPDATDDNINGILFQLCDGLHVPGARVENLLWKATAGDTAINDNTRGIASSGLTNSTLVRPYAENVGQGMDSSGDLGSGNVGNTYIAPRMKTCGTWGFKLANLTKRARVIDGRAEGCVYAGFVDSTSWDTPIDDSDKNAMSDCVSLDCGKASGSSAGFLKLAGVRTYQNFTDYFRCAAIDTRATPLMQYGFKNEGTETASVRARMRDCVSVGHTTAPQSGFESDRQYNAETVSSVSINGADTYLVASELSLPPAPRMNMAMETARGGGPQYLFETALTKTAAGTGTPVVTLRFGTNGSTADTALVALTFGAQTAATATAILRVRAYVRTYGSGASTRIDVTAELVNDGATVGFATQNVSVRRGASSAFDAQVAGAVLGVSIDPGASAVWTSYGATAQLVGVADA